MKPADAYDDAVDLLDADHKAVKKLFIDFNALCDDGAAPDAKRPVADKICQALLIHMQIEEEIFYPAVRAGTGDKPLIEEAIDEHAQAKETIAQIQAMDSADDKYDDTVKRLGELIDAHALEERCRSSTHPRLTTISTSGRRAGRRSFSSPACVELTRRL